jgi:hypothetical protein
MVYVKKYRLGMQWFLRAQFARRKSTGVLELPECGMVVAFGQGQQNRTTLKGGFTAIPQ